MTPNLLDRIWGRIASMFSMERDWQDTVFVPFPSSGGGSKPAELPSAEKTPPPPSGKSGESEKSSGLDYRIEPKIRAVIRKKIRDIE